MLGTLDVLRAETEHVAGARPSRVRQETIAARLPLRGLAAAACIALAFVVYRSTRTTMDERPTALIATAEAVQGPALGITLQGESRDQLLVVAAAGSPEVQIYRLYHRLEAIEARETEKSR